MIYYSLVILLSIVGIISTVSAQTLPFRFQNLNALSHDGQYISDSVMMIVGEHGKILRSENAGKTWAWMESYKRAHFRRLHFISPDVGYIVGDSGIVLHTMNGGKNWDIRYFPDNTMSAVWSINDNIAFIVSDKGNIYRTSDAGLSWENIYKDSSISFSDIYFTNNTFGIAVGNKGTVLRTDDGGKTWSSLFSREDADFTRVRFVNPNIGYVAGGLKRTGDFGVYHLTLIMRTDDGGKNWRIQSDTTHQYQILGLAIANNGYSAMASAQGGFYYWTTDIGNTWTRDTLNLKKWKSPLTRPLTYLPSVSYLKPDKGMMVGDGNLIAFSDNFTSWNVDRWADITQYSTDYTVSHIHFYDQNRCSLFMNGGRIAYSEDGGVTFILQYPTTDKPGIAYDSEWATLHSPADGEVAAFGIQRFAGNTNMVARTFDEGKTWTRTDEISNIQTIFPTRQRGYVNTGKKPLRLARTDDGGKTWIPLNNYQGWSVNISSFSPDTLFVRSQQFISNKDTVKYPIGYYLIHTLYKSTDAGTSFSIVYKDSSYNIAFTTLTRLFDSDTLIGMTTTDSTIISNDLGKTWKVTPNFFIPRGYRGIANMYFHNKNLGFLLLSGDSILMTINRGKTWTLYPLDNNYGYKGDPIRGYRHILRGPNDSTIFFTNNNRYVRCILPRELLTITSAKEDIEEGSFNRYFYIETKPSPALSVMEIILYGLYSVKNNPLTVKVFSILGNEVADYSREANQANNGSTARFTVDISRLPLGVYILQYSAGGYQKSSLFAVSK